MKRALPLFLTGTRNHKPKCWSYSNLKKSKKILKADLESFYQYNQKKMYSGTPLEKAPRSSYFLYTIIAPHLWATFVGMDAVDPDRGEGA